MPFSLAITLQPLTLAVLIALPVLFLLFILAIRHFARRKLISDMHLVIDDLLHGRTDRRADPTVAGRLGDVARSVNRLAAHVDEQQVRTAEFHEHLDALLEHTDESVIATDADDLVRLLNPAASRLLDRPLESFLGRPITEFPTPLNHPDLLAVYHAAYHSPAPVSRQLRLPLSRRTVQCLVTASTMYSGAVYRGTLLLIRDLTEITQAVQMKTDFVTNASHELRTPLASIRAAVETIQGTGTGEDDSPPLDDLPTIRRCIDIIGANVLRLQLMVQDLLDLSRTEDPRAVVRAEPIDLMHVCELITGMYAALAAEKKITVAVNLAPEASSLTADERLLIITLKNLVDNAIKFTPAGGEVTIRSSIEAGMPIGEVSDPALPVKDRPSMIRPAPAACLVLEVVDSGCGIPAEDQQRVFERFYTVNRSRGGADRGTGLGLAIVKHALTAMGAAVELRSQLHEGTTVRCIFPLPAPTSLHPRMRLQAN